MGKAVWVGAVIINNKGQSAVHDMSWWAGVIWEDGLTVVVDGWLGHHHCGSEQLSMGAVK
jgi:hypothetical protein